MFANSIKVKIMLMKKSAYTAEPETEITSAGGCRSRVSRDREADQFLYSESAHELTT